MTPRQLWDAFEGALGHSVRDFDDDQHELGQPGNYGKLKKKYRTVIGYWLDRETCGGHMMLESGYIENVDPAVLSMVHEYQARLKKAKKKIVKEVFGS